MPEKSKPSSPSQPSSKHLRKSTHPSARLEGNVTLHGKLVPLSYDITSDTLVMGRSDPDTLSSDPFKPVKRDGVQLGLGPSPKLSRAHLKIQYNPSTHAFFLYCLGKNGVTVTQPRSSHHASLVPASDPVSLASATEIKVADCSMKFYLSPPPSPTQSHTPSTPDRNNITNTTPDHATLNADNDPPKSSRTARPSAQSQTTANGKRKRREWTKSEHAALRAQLMRFGYGRWEEIIAGATGRLTERHPHELIPVARKFVASCYVHARPGVERRALMEILRQGPRERLHSDDEAIDKEVTSFLQSVTEDTDPADQRKYVRWARKLRLLNRLNEVHDHSSVQRLRTGDLRVFTPPPTLYWTSADDADLLLGSYKHGYGAAEALRTDPAFGFHNRYSKSLVVKKATTPSKPNKPISDAANVSDEDEDDDEDADEDEDERKARPLPTDDHSKSALALNPHNPKKRQKLGDGTAKSDLNGEMEESSEGIDADSSVIPTASSAHPDVSTPQEPPEADKIKKKVRLVPKRGPRIGNEDGFNNLEDALAAHEAVADENGLAPFPPSEPLMRRLKSLINSCSKEFERDQREQRKKQLADKRAKQRKNDLAEKKAIKEAEKTRQRAERRIAKSQPFSKKDAVEFEKALSNFGVSYLEDGKTVDWDWFRGKVDGFEAKYSETMWSAYVELLAEAHRIRDLAAAKEDEDYETVERLNNSKKPSAVFSTLTVERAERLIDRLQFFRNLRGDVLPHPKVGPILRGLKKGKDLPAWWKSSHDKSLLLGVDRYGLNGWEEMSKDPQLTFANSMKSWQKKTGSDGKPLRRAVMPKANQGAKRAFALVQYFSSRANDPHFEIYSQAENGLKPTGTRDGDGEGDVEVKVEPKKEDAEISREPQEDVAMKEVVTKKEDLVNLSVSTSHGVSGRPRSLRQTVLAIGKDENGILMLPANLGDGLILLNLGEVVQGGMGFCRNEIIFPLGYRSIRQVGGRAYLCEIVSDLGKTEPEFRVSEVFGFNENAREEDFMWENHRVISRSRSIMAAWLKVANEEANDGGVESGDRVALACGAERFGLYESTIVYHIQKLPGAKFVDGFEVRDFTQKGRGAKVEPSVGILEVMLKALDSKLEPIDERSNSDAVLSDDEDAVREGAVLAEEAEMSLPSEWLELYSGQKRKQRRRGSVYGA